jgi:hypothetical protein
MRPTVICFPLYIRLLAFGPAYPGGPSPCLSHYSQALGYYAASVLPSALWHFRAPPRRVRRQGSSPVPTRETYQQPLAACFTPGGAETTPAGESTVRPTAIPFWVRCISPFHLSYITTPLTQVPFVRIGRRTGRSAAWSWLLSSYCPQASDPRGCQPLTPAAWSWHRCPSAAPFRSHPSRR